MKEVERDGLRLLVFSSLEETGVVCATSTQPLDVRQEADRRRFVAAVGLDPDRVVSPRQEHKSTVVRVEEPSSEPIDADGLVTDVAGQPLLLRAADCTLLAVVDPERHALGVAHAGWRGSARGVVVNLLKTLHDEYGSHPSRLIAAVGPTIGVDRYPVGPEVPAAFIRTRDWVKDYVRPKEGRLHFDLAGVNAHFLVECGVPRENIEMAGLCTYENKELLHSFRRDDTHGGHHGLVAAWRD